MWVRVEPGKRTTVDFGDSATTTEVNGTLEVRTKFKSWSQTIEIIDAFKERSTVSFTYEILEL